ncbi:MAG: helix-turn-helix domain-containing protein [Gemmatimonadota bacterium]
MYDNYHQAPAPLAGCQIRDLRRARGWSLDELARRAGTSAPTVHRYESGWDRFELATLRKIASALGASFEVRLRPTWRTLLNEPLGAPELVRRIAPLFWDKPLAVSDLTDHARWVLGRVLMFGEPEQVRAARRFFGDEAIADAVRARAIDARTRNYWNLILSQRHASEGPESRRLEDGP